MVCWLCGSDGVGWLCGSGGVVVCRFCGSGSVMVVIVLW